MRALRLPCWILFSVTMTTWFLTACSMISNSWLRSMPAVHKMQIGVTMSSSFRMHSKVPTVLSGFQLSHKDRPSKRTSVTTFALPEPPSKFPVLHTKPFSYHPTQKSILQHQACTMPCYLSTTTSRMTSSFGRWHCEQVMAQHGAMHPNMLLVVISCQV